MKAQSKIRHRKFSRFSSSSSTHVSARSEPKTRANAESRPEYALALSLPVVELETCYPSDEMIYSVFFPWYHENYWSMLQEMEMDRKCGVTLQFGPDNPVGTGFSYAEDAKLLVKNDDENAADLTTLLIEVFNSQKSLQNNPLYIVGESYGGKVAVTLALSALKAIKNRRLKLKLGGVALGNSWMSPEDYVFSWGPLLSDVSRLDNNGLNESNSVANQIKQQLAAGKFAEATASVDKLQDVIIQNSNAVVIFTSGSASSAKSSVIWLTAVDWVNMYNFLYDQSSQSSSQATSELSKKMWMKGYSRYLNSLATTSCDGDLDTQLNYLVTLMNGQIRNKLKIIPKSVRWVLLADPVYEAMVGDFMKPRIQEVDQLLAQGVNVTIYNGQITYQLCSIIKWSGLNRFLLTKRIPFYCGAHPEYTAGFVRSYNNFKFYWILGAGHLVPLEQPCTALDMITNITQSPALS
ncbi:serine carboxypeptidase-like 51 [Striga asiatica]|uniref:Carboxypeptidase n=1 Tax=Striga asiatica TaxID=4170 RepID=A0A5A7Q3H5_STRAF|nr:serine carboxypeptidase-like 51 [Striga asiatica]